MKEDSESSDEFEDSNLESENSDSESIESKVKRYKIANKNNAQSKSENGFCSDDIRISSPYSLRKVKDINQSFDCEILDSEGSRGQTTFAKATTSTDLDIESQNCTGKRLRNYTTFSKAETSRVYETDEYVEKARNSENKSSYANETTFPDYEIESSNGNKPIKRLRAQLSKPTARDIEPENITDDHMTSVKASTSIEYEPENCSLVVKTNGANNINSKPLGNLTEIKLKRFSKNSKEKSKSIANCKDKKLKLLSLKKVQISKNKTSKRELAVRLRNRVEVFNILNNEINKVQAAILKYNISNFKIQEIIKTENFYFANKIEPKFENEIKDETDVKVIAEVKPESPSLNEGNCEDKPPLEDIKIDIEDVPLFMDETVEIKSESGGIQEFDIDNIISSKFGKLPQVCQFEGCSTQIRNNKSLRIHVRSHLDKNKYPCKECSYSCNSINGIALHKRIHRVSYAKFMFLFA